jgi:hypothetical protein
MPLQPIIVIQESHDLHFMAIGHGGNQLATIAPCAVD